MEFNKYSNFLALSPYQQVSKTSVHQVGNCCFEQWDEKGKSPRKKVFEPILTIELPWLRVMPKSVAAEGESIAYMSFCMCLRKLLPNTGEFKGKILKYHALSCVLQKENKKKVQLNNKWQRLKLPAHSSGLGSASWPCFATCLYDENQLRSFCLLQWKQDLGLWYRSCSQVLNLIWEMRHSFHTAVALVAAGMVYMSTHRESGKTPPEWCFPYW